jgi:polyferredoxin
LISVTTGGALVFYFSDAPTLVRVLVHGEASVSVWAWIAVFTGTTYGLAGFAREQVCTFMCPWPRLQGAIWDPEAFTVNYRDYRGEKRMSAKKAAEAQPRRTGRRLRELQPVRQRLPGRHRHKGGAEFRLHQLRSRGPFPACPS